MAGIAQINANYLPGEDRILMRISTTAGEEFRLWLTRRLVSSLAVAFARAVDSWADSLTPGDLPGREALRDFKREQLGLQGDFSRDYEGEGKTLPLGEAAILAVGGNLSLSETEATLSMALADGRSLNLQLGAILASGLHRLLTDAAAKADWQLVNPAPPVHPVHQVHPIH